MRKKTTIKCGQYAYTRDGRVIQIDSVNEKNGKYGGHDISLNDQAEIELDNNDIHGFFQRL